MSATAVSTVHRADFSRQHIASTFKNLIIPLPSSADDEQGWVERLLMVTSRLDATNLKTFERITGLQGFAT